MPISKIGKGFAIPKKVGRLRAFKRKLPRIIANTSLNWYLAGFRKGGGQTDAGAWRARKATSKRNRGRGILIDTGALRRDIRIRKVNAKRIILGTARVVYARRHNEGLKGMPKREFLGDSKNLNKKNKKIILRGLDKILG